MSQSPSKQGLWCAIAAYVLWGVLPVYWKALQSIPASRILCHRVIWSFCFLAGLVLVRGEARRFRTSISAWRPVAIYALAAVLLSVTWFTYIWAVNAGRIVDTSLGYYINPLVSVVLGLVFLRERLHRLQWIAVILAALAVVYLTWQQGGLPWIALVLAITFGVYGLLKKTAPLGALHGLVLETALLVLPALGFLLLVPASRPPGASGGLWIPLLLMGTGIVTAMPLLLFAQAARLTSLSTLGILQYMSPTCGLLVGVFLYHEPFTSTRLVAFAVIWVALLIYWLDLVRLTLPQRRRVG